MKHILIVDDDPIIRLATSEVLKSKNYQVSEANDGLEAIAKMEQGGIDLILLDIFMPNKDGFETIGEIRRNFSDVKVVVMSGYEENRFNPLEYARSLGADEALSKPFSADDLICVLEKHLA